MSDPKLSVLNDLHENFNELFHKATKYGDQFPEIADKLLLIVRKLREVNTEIEETVLELDSQRFQLSEEEKQRLENDEVVDRATERIKPLMLVSLLIESLNEGSKVYMPDEYSFLN